MPNPEDRDRNPFDHDAAETNGQAPDIGDALVITKRSRKQKTRRIFSIVWLTVSCLAFVACAVAAFVKVDYYSHAPGRTSAVDSLLEIAPGDRFDHRGQMYFTTVSESSSRISALKYFIDKNFNEDVELVPAKEIESSSGNSCFTPAQVDERTFSTSQRIALSVALRRLNKPVTTTFSYFQIVEVVKGSAADGNINVCDRLVSIDGQTIISALQPQTTIRSKKPGDMVNVVLADQKTKVERSVDIRLGETDGHAFLGIVNGPIELNVSTSENVSFPKSDIGGPSAGLALTVGLIDDLSPGDLTGGEDIAATGQMALDGTIGEVGGIKQKTISVHRRGIRLFLVPEENFAEAKKSAPKGLEVVSVHTLDEAITILRERGGDASAVPPPVDLTKF